MSKKTNISLTDNFSQLSFREKVEKLDDFNISLLKFVKENVFERTDSEGKSISLDVSELNETMRVISTLSKNLQSSTFKVKEIEQRDEIDFNHRKIEMAFKFLIETVLHSMTEVGIDEKTKSMFANTLSRKLIGFEDKLNTTLGKVHVSAVESVKNPLVDIILNKD